jgi:hypothetical protein
MTGSFEYGGKFSFIVCKEAGGIASALYHANARKRVNKTFFILYVYMGNTMPYCRQSLACKLCRLVKPVL